MPEPIIVKKNPGTFTLLPKESADLRPKINAMQLMPRSQGGRGTCSVFASTFLVEYMTSKERGLVGLDLSEEYLNAASNMATGVDPTVHTPMGDGDFFHGIAAGYEQFGVVDEVWFPYQSSFDPNLKPDAELQVIGKAARFLAPHVDVSGREEKIGLTEAQLTLIREQLDQGVPVARAAVFRYMRVMTPPIREAIRRSDRVGERLEYGNDGVLVVQTDRIGHLRPSGRGR